MEMRAMEKKTTVFEALPYEMQVRSGLEGIFVATLVAEGLVATRAKIAAGIPVRDVLELEAFQAFLSAATPLSSLEGYALRAGSNASLGWAINELVKQEAAQTPPGLKSWVNKARSGFGLKKISD